ncbi:hypothetical protein QFZ56_000094 [Streptomyces achromogenes]|uniref:Transposase n=1 Tax=Streptomyces achromogenes TaxID=67255 RepID=A0ABU0PT61_STRAH|nr:hypothetical protein [Streptomyces achromogenes]MDQ0681131.1 hypothetical protein [Streptomyces achromogenes]
MPIAAARPISPTATERHRLKNAVTSPELAREAVKRGIAPFLSASTVRRWLARDALKPWQHHSWIFITDPHLCGKAARVLDMYARTWHGAPLGADEFVVQRRREDLHPGPAAAATPPSPPARPARC